MISVVASLGRTSGSEAAEHFGKFGNWHKLEATTDSITPEKSELFEREQVGPRGRNGHAVPSRVGFVCGCCGRVAQTKERRRQSGKGLR